MSAQCTVQNITFFDYYSAAIYGYYIVHNNKPLPHTYKPSISVATVTSRNVIVSRYSVYLPAISGTYSIIDTRGNEAIRVTLQCNEYNQQTIDTVELNIEIHEDLTAFAEVYYGNRVNKVPVTIDIAENLVLYCAQQQNNNSASLNACGVTCTTPQVARFSTVTNATGIFDQDFSMVTGAGNIPSRWSLPLKVECTLNNNTVLVMTLNAVLTYGYYMQIMLYSQYRTQLSAILVIR